MMSELLLTLVQSAALHVVSQPAAAPNFGVANSMIYGHCGNNLFEPASVFNKLAKAGDRKAV
jgi:hypothetical protein